MNYSVLMSVYYKENPIYLRESLESMFSQTVLTDDFILVADGKLTRELYDVIDEFETRYAGIFQMIQLDENLGLGQALNAGLEHCKNELVARMDSDDISLADRCQLQMEIFTKNPEVDIVSGTLYEFDGDKNNIVVVKKLPENNDDIREYAKRRSPFNHPCVMYKKSTVVDSGGYQHFLWFEDYYLWIRMLQNNAIAYNIPEPILLMRSGNKMYERRGGSKYLKQMVKFRKYMYDVKFCSLFTFIYVTCMQSFVCVLPTKLRVKIYKNFLRGI